MQFAAIENQASCFKYCPRCGQKAIGTFENKAYQCSACDFIFFHNSPAATVAMIEDAEGRLLVATRAHDPAKGTLDLPGGFVDPNETLEQALTREVKEELNLNVTKLMFQFSLPNRYFYKDVHYHTIDAVFKCEVETLDTLKAMDDVAKVQFLNKTELNPDQFGLSSIKTIIQRYI